jgi:broad specificity phosphatase PhoE
MKKLYFIRHGESEANEKRLFAGRWDISLTAAGREQARAEAAQVKKLGIDCIVSSPLRRARETAEIIADGIGYPKKDIIYSDLFMERDYGDLQGKPWDSADKINFDEVPNIEPEKDLMARAATSAKMLQEIKADNVLLVGHGTSGRLIRDQLLNQSGRVEVSIHEEIPNSSIVEWI